MPSADMLRERLDEHRGMAEHFRAELDECSLWEEVRAAKAYGPFSAGGIVLARMIEGGAARYHERRATRIEAQLGPRRLT